MTLKKCKYLVFGSLFVQLIILLVVNQLSSLNFPQWLGTILFFIVPYLIWLIQIFIGKATGLTTGISSSLLALAYLWNLIISLNGYEWLLLPTFLVSSLPLILVIIAIILAGYEFIKSFKKTLVKPTRSFPFKNKSSIVIATLLPLFMLFPGKAPLMTLSYVDQGVRPAYLSGGFLLFLTIPTLLMLVLSFINLKSCLTTQTPKQIKIASLLLVIAFCLFAIVSIFLPFLFWYGINPLIFTVLAICVPLTIQTKNSTK